jgi:hypothetical protein
MAFCSGVHRIHGNGWWDSWHMDIGFEDCYLDSLKGNTLTAEYNEDYEILLLPFYHLHKLLILHHLEYEYVGRQSLTGCHIARARVKKFLRELDRNRLRLCLLSMASRTPRPAPPRPEMPGPRSSSSTILCLKVIFTIRASECSLSLT